MSKFSVLLGLLLSACATLDDQQKETESANIYLQLGVRYMDLNKLSIAQENLQIALKKDPTNPQVFNALGFLYEKLQDNLKAKQYYQQALELTPNDWSVQNNFGRFLCDHNEYSKGLALLKQAGATSLNDKTWIALTNAGRCELDRHQKQRAKAYFEQALLINNGYVPALLEMQKVSFQDGDYLVAQTYFVRYLELGAYTPETLWIAKQTEFALGHNESAKEYEKILKDNFPLAKEAKY